MAKGVKRLFKLTDEALLERAYLFHDAVEGELAAFTSRIPWLDAAWLNAYKNEIDDAKAFPTDKSVTLSLKVLTSDVNQVMHQSYAALQTLGGYAVLAWPTDVARQRAFGQNNWRLARRNSLKLQEALELAHSTATSLEFKPALLAKGFAQAEMDGLITLFNQLKQFNNGQEGSKLERTVSTRDRISRLNAIWKHMQSINTCASIVWASDASRSARYTMYAQGTLKGTKTNKEQ
jgi:hypothetical protein